MPILSTEFPVRSDVSKAEFIAQAISWVKGMDSSSLFRGEMKVEDFSDEVSISSKSGERFILKEHILDDGFVAGARHVINDEEGRIWQSEFILTSIGDRAALRSRNQCLSLIDGARVAVPRRPHFLTMAFDDEWPIRDAELPISRDLHYLSDADVDLAANLINGLARTSLPTVYFSIDNNRGYLLESQSIHRLARGLSGFAHCVVEPNKNFSVKLKSKTSSTNPYGGTIAICVPIYGVVKKFYINNSNLSAHDISSRVYNFVTSYVSNRRNEFAWEWQDLIERSASILREKARAGQVEISDWIKSRDEEIAETDAVIRDLRAQIDQLQKDSLDKSKENEGILTQSAKELLGAEIYSGEFEDRLIIACQFIESDESNQFDNRTKRFADRFLSINKWSGGANRLKSRLSQAGRDASTADRRLGEILMELGFSKRNSSGHPVYIPNELYGVDQQTLSCSPSDSRSGKNAASQIIRDLGLQSIRE